VQLIFCIVTVSATYFLSDEYLFSLQSVQLERLALYHDSDHLPWEIDKRWEDINPPEWIEVCCTLFDNFNLLIL